MSDEPKKIDFSKFQLPDTPEVKDFSDEDFSAFGVEQYSGSFTGKLVKGAGVPPRPSRVRGWRSLPLMPDAEPDRSL